MKVGTANNSYTVYPKILYTTYLEIWEVVFGSPAALRKMEWYVVQGLRTDPVFRFVHTMQPNAETSNN